MRNGEVQQRMQKFEHHCFSRIMAAVPDAVTVQSDTRTRMIDYTSLQHPNRAMRYHFEPRIFLGASL
jgi:hypothetical protein